MKYKRPKREDAAMPPRKDMSIAIGCVDDSFETLKTMCNDKCIELMKTLKLELNEGEDMEIAFFFADFGELIGTSRISKNESGSMSFTLDFSSNTL